MNNNPRVRSKIEAMPEDGRSWPSGQEGVIFRREGDYVEILPDGRDAAEPGSFIVCLAEEVEVLP